jgi:hypothetical protein
LVVLEDNLRDKIIELAKNKTDQYLTEKLGISYNTFRKIESRLPVRDSLANRLRVRLSLQENEGDGESPSLSCSGEEATNASC